MSIFTIDAYFIEPATILVNTSSSTGGNTGPCSIFKSYTFSTISYEIFDVVCFNLM